LCTGIREQNDGIGAKMAEIVGNRFRSSSRCVRKSQLQLHRAEAMGTRNAESTGMGEWQTPYLSGLSKISVIAAVYDLTGSHIIPAQLTEIQTQRYEHTKTVYFILTASHVYYAAMLHTYTHTHTSTCVNMEHDTLVRMTPV
jgi:hypothetical protein